jgi:hypothetical protein
MAETTVLDHYFLTLNSTSENESSHPIRAIAINTADSTKMAEAWWSRDGTVASLLGVLRAEPSYVDWYLQQLDDHHVVELAAALPSVKPGKAIFNTAELIRMGFDPNDLEL